MTTEQRLILASSSTYRRELLSRLRLPFAVCAPDFEEAAVSNMPPDELVRHNTIGKARAVSHIHPEARIIASDQLAVCGDKVLGKPGNHTTACKQLSLASGKSVDFLTGIILKQGKEERYSMVPYRVCFRDLQADEIDAYLTAEKPFDCAGSFKSEGLGISLFTRMQGDDPTALMGLPLITLSTWLRPLQSSCIHASFR